MRLLIAAGGVTGLLIGVLATSHVWIVFSRLLREAAVAEYQTEQVILASRARNSGDSFRAAVHALNVADAQAEIGFLWLRRSRSETNWDWFSLPWTSYWDIQGIAPYMASSPKLEKGRRLAEAQYRAQAALALESFGHPDLASLQWRRASELNPRWSLERQREFALEHPLSYGEAYESAYLGSETYAEFTRALAELDSEGNAVE